MKYSGSTMIVDDEGNVVFERELNEDEIVEVLLAALPDADEDADIEHEPEHAQVGERTPPALPQSANSSGKPCCGSKQNRHKKTCQFAEPVPEPDHSSDPDVRACCGASTHGRHKKGCSKSAPTDDPQRRFTVDNRHPFSQPTYNIIKDMLDVQARTVDSISSEKGLDLAEVRRCNLADDYDDYLAIA